MKTNTKYGLHGRLTAREGKREELAEILLNASILLRSAIGCHLYMVSLDPQYPNDVWITEIWDSKEHHDHSLDIPGVRELIGKAVPILEGSPQKGQELEILGGLGVD